MWNKIGLAISVPPDQMLWNAATSQEPVCNKYWNLSCLMTKSTKWHVCQAETQISLGRKISLSIRPVWSVFACAQWVAKDPSFLHADSEDWSDWADAQADLSLCWAHSHFVGFVMRRLNCSWNDFYSHSPRSADSGRAVVSYLGMYVLRKKLEG